MYDRLLLAALLYAPVLCGAARFAVEPGLSKNPNVSVPLAAILRFSPSERVKTTVDVSDGTHRWQLHFDGAQPPENGLPIVGMRPGREHEIRVTIRGKDGKDVTFERPLSFRTPALPSKAGAFPPLKITTTAKGETEPGFTVISLRTEAGKYGVLLAVDEDGVPVWYYEPGAPPSDFQRLPNGHILVMLIDQRIREIDILGNLVAEWYAARRSEGKDDAVLVNATAVDGLSLHHEFEMLPSGNLAALSTERREVPNFYSSDRDANAPRKNTFVMGDRLVEFRRDGKVVWDWNVFDHLDPMRIGYGALGPFWVRRGFPDTADWTHGNAFTYIAADDSYLVSLRHQSAIFKVDRKSGDIRWILGDPQGYSEKLRGRVLKPEGGMRWPYYGHTVRPTPQGTLLFFDNAVYGTMPFTPPRAPSEVHSRAVEYTISEKAGTIREVWSSDTGDKDDVIGIDMGGVAWLPKTRHVLVCYGSAAMQRGSTWPELAAGRRNTRVREFTHTQPARVVWEALVEDPSADGASWAAYRAEKWTDLVGGGR